MDFEFEGEENVISMFDEDGNETQYLVLTVKEEDERMFMLVEAEIDEDESEVLILKRIASPEFASGEELFELVDEEHEDFDMAFELFKDDLDTLEISY